MRNPNQYSLQYEFTFNDILVRPGAFLKLKGWFGLVQYECIMHDLEKNVDYLLVLTGNEKRMFPVNRLKGVVLLKRSRNK